MLNYLKAIYRYKLEKKNFNRINELAICSTGKEDGLLFVQLESGLKFFGYPSDQVLRRQFQLFAPKRIKNKISPEHFNIALDIVKRYLPHKNLDEARKKSRFLDVKMGDVILEGGAFTGYYAMQLSEKVGKNGLIVAIEAAPENFEILKKNIESNHLINVKVLNRALTDQVGILNFYRNKKQVGSLIDGIVKEKEVVKVQGDKIDNIIEELNLKKVDHIRLQLNGAEFKALKGMVNTFKHKPQMLIAAPYEKDGIPFWNEITNYLSEKEIVSQRVLGNVCVNINDEFVLQQ